MFNIINVKVEIKVTKSTYKTNWFERVILSQKRPTIPKVTDTSIAQVTFLSTISIEVDSTYFMSDELSSL